MEKYGFVYSENDTQIEDNQDFINIIVKDFNDNENVRQMIFKTYEILGDKIKKKCVGVLKAILDKNHFFYIIAISGKGVKDDGGKVIFNNDTLQPLIDEFSKHEYKGIVQIASLDSKQSIYSQVKK